MKKVNKVMIEQETYFCDICGKPRSYRCNCCHKDICRDCVEFDDKSSNDYPDKYCEACWKIGEPFRKKMEEIEEQSYSEEVKLKEEWFKKAGGKI